MGALTKVSLEIAYDIWTDPPPRSIVAMVFCSSGVSGCNSVGTTPSASRRSGSRDLAAASGSSAYELKPGVVCKTYNVTLEQEEDHKPAIAKSPSDPLSLSNNRNVSDFQPPSRDLQVDASLSNWLIWSENKPPSGASGDRSTAATATAYTPTAEQSAEHRRENEEGYRRRPPPLVAVARRSGSAQGWSPSLIGENRRSGSAQGWSPSLVARQRSWSES
nr:nuclear polyadenylated RNA-binding protein 3-like [Ipomoea batatas]